MVVPSIGHQGYKDISVLDHDVKSPTVANIILSCCVNLLFCNIFIVIYIMHVFAVQIIIFLDLSLHWTVLSLCLIFHKHVHVMPDASPFKSLE